jgi:hypothetical protein
MLAEGGERDREWVVVGGGRRTRLAAGQTKEVRARRATVKIERATVPRGLKGVGWEVASRAAHPVASANFSLPAVLSAERKNPGPDVKCRRLAGIARAINGRYRVVGGGRGGGEDAKEVKKAVGRKTEREPRGKGSVNLVWGARVPSAASLRTRFSPIYNQFQSAASSSSARVKCGWQHLLSTGSGERKGNDGPRAATGLGWMGLELPCARRINGVFLVSNVSPRRTRPPLALRFNYESIDAPHLYPSPA